MILKILHFASIRILNRIILGFVLLLLLLLRLLLLLTLIVIIQVLSTGLLILGDPEKCINYLQRIRKA